MFPKAYTCIACCCFHTLPTEKHPSGLHHTVSFSIFFSFVFRKGKKKNNSKTPPDKYKQGFEKHQISEQKVWLLLGVTSWSRLFPRQFHSFHTAALRIQTLQRLLQSIKTALQKKILNLKATKESQGWEIWGSLNQNLMLLEISTFPTPSYTFFLWLNFIWASIVSSLASDLMVNLLLTHEEN